MSRLKDQHSGLPVNIERFTAGLVTNRDPLHVQLVSHGLNVIPLFDALIDGSNVELSPRNTLVRRPGFSPYCSVAIPSGSPLAFAGFRTTSSNYALLDTTTNVYQFTTSAMTSLFTKGTTGQTYFQQAGQQLFCANGTDVKKIDSTLNVTNWGIAAPTGTPTVANVAAAGSNAWAANTFYNPSLLLYDSNSNLQLLTTPGTTNGTQPVWATSVGVTTTDGSAVWTCQGPAARQTNHVYAAGSYIEIDYTVSYTYYTYDPGSHTVVPNTGTVTYHDFFKTIAGGTSSSTATGSITWAPGIGGQVTDGTVLWVNQGTKITWSTIGATTLVSTNTFIADSNGNQETPTKAGKSGGSAPTWSTVLNAVTADSGTSWTNNGPISAANSLQWRYVFVFRNSTTAHISATSPESQDIFLAASSNIAVSSTGSSDSQVDKIDIYRTKQGGGIYYLLDTVSNPVGGSSATWSYIDSLNDSLLNTEKIVTTVPINSPPPSGATRLAFYQGRIWMASGSNLYFDAGGDCINGASHESFPPANVFPYLSDIKALVPTSQGLLVLTADSINVILGGPQTLTYYSQTLMQGIGVLSQNCITQDNDQIYLLSGQGQGITISPSDMGEFGFVIADTLKSTFPPSSSYLAMHRSGADSGIFLSDGSTYIQRFNQVANIWSPKATPVNGCGPIASIETSVGTFYLLTTINGHVCKRDLTTWQDGTAAASYTAFATIGSIAVAPMSADPVAIRSIFTRTVNTGSLPTVAVLQNSTSGTFADVFVTCSVPAQLAGTPLESTSVLQRRYDLNRATGIALARFNHLQLKLSWSAENAGNELTGVSLAGVTE